MAKQKKKRSGGARTAQRARSAPAAQPAKGDAQPAPVKVTASAAKKRLELQGLLVSIAFFFLLVFTIFPSGQITYFTKFSKTFYAGGFINLVLIVSAVWMVWKRRGLSWNWGIVIFGGYTLYLAVVSLFYEGYYTSYYLAKHLAFLNIMLLAENYLSKQSIGTLAIALGMALGSMGLFYAAGLAGLFDGPGGNPDNALVFHSLHFGLDADGKGPDPTFGGRRQLELTFGNPNMFGSFLALMIPLVVCGMMLQRKWGGRILLGAVGASMVIMAFHSDSRNAIGTVSGLGLVSVAAAGSILFSKTPSKILVPFMAVIVVCGAFGGAIVMDDIFGEEPFLPLRQTAQLLGAFALAVLCVLIGIFAHKRLPYYALVFGYLAFLGYCAYSHSSEFAVGKFNDTGKGVSDGGRNFAYQVALDLASEEPATLAFGRGPGSLYQNVFEADTVDYDYVGTNKSYLFAHQENLEILLQGGIVGSIIHYGLALLTVGICALGALQNDRSPQERIFAIGLLLSVCAFYFFGMFSLAVRYSATEFPYHLVLALAWALYSPRKLPPAPHWAWLVVLPFAALSLVTVYRTFYSDNYLVKAVTGLNRGTLDADQGNRMLQQAVDLFPQNIHAKTQIFLQAYNRPTGPDIAVLDEIYPLIEAQIPNFKEIRFFYGRACFLAGRSDDAIVHTKAYVDYNHFAYTARACLGAYYWFDGQPDQFLRTFDEIVLTAITELRLRKDALISAEIIEQDGKRNLQVTQEIPSDDGSEIELDVRLVNLDKYYTDLQNSMRFQVEPRATNNNQRVSVTVSLLMQAAVQVLTAELETEIPRGILNIMRER
ncbi:MAG: O-antigen ligase family protein [Opitutales bacterium]